MAKKSAFAGQRRRFGSLDHLHHGGHCDDHDDSGDDHDGGDDHDSGDDHNGGDNDWQKSPPSLDSGADLGRSVTFIKTMMIGRKIIWMMMMMMILFFVTGSRLFRRVSGFGPRLLPSFPPAMIFLL